MGLISGRGTSSGACGISIVSSTSSNANDTASSVSVSSSTSSSELDSSSSSPLNNSSPCSASPYLPQPTATCLPPRMYWPAATVSHFFFSGFLTALAFPFLGGFVTLVLLTFLTTTVGIDLNTKGGGGSGSGE